MTRDEIVETARDIIHRSETWTYASEEMSPPQPPLTTLARAVLEMHADNDKLRAALREACDLSDEGWGYAPDYFRTKWLQPGRIAELRKLTEEP